MCELSALLLATNHLKELSTSVLIQNSNNGTVAPRSPKVLCCTNCHPTFTSCLPLCPCYVSLDALCWFELLCLQAYGSSRPYEFMVLLCFLPKHWVLITVWMKRRYDSPFFLSLQCMYIGGRANQ